MQIRERFNNRILKAFLVRLVRFTALIREIKGTEKEKSEKKQKEKQIFER